MKITLEADYAVRIVYFLAKSGELTGASVIAEGTGVTLRFALKILRKLTLAGIVESRKGANGGYCLKPPPGEITLLQVIEAIDGQICVNRCGADDAPCSRVGASKNSCCFHRIFNETSLMVRKKLGECNFADVN